MNDGFYFKYGFRTSIALEGPIQFQSFIISVRLSYEQTQPFKSFETELSSKFKVKQGLQWPNG